MERRGRPVDAEVLSGSGRPSQPPSAQRAPVILALIGPTAVGKTALSLDLAERLGAEIVSADSRQVYRPLTIGTAKPTVEELARVRHHFIDELELGDPFSAGRFAEQAEARIAEILSRGRKPLVVGGSTLYLEALLHGLAEIPATSPATRDRLMHRLGDEGRAALFAELQRLDPASASRMDATKTQRVVRALEVLHDTGRPLSHYHTQRSTPRFDFAPVVLSRPRAVLYERINRRVDHMLEAGLLDENRRLLEAGVSPTLNPLRTIGYREPLAHLRGEVEYAEMVRRLKRNTRRYAKRQLTWFRRHPGYRWLDLRAVDSPQVMETFLAITVQ